MTTTTATTILGGVCNVGLVLLLAPFAQGVLRKLTARIQSRQGPPLCQPYYDLLKLLGKEDLECGESPPLQRFVACLALATILAVAGLVPLGMPAPFAGLGDGLLLIYLLTLCGVATALAGLAAGSTWSLVGISREIMSLITLEPVFAIAIAVGAIQTGSFQLTPLLEGGLYRSSGFPWSGLVMLGVMLLAFPAFVQRVPFDTTEAETELMEGPLMEYSGPKLALFKYAQMARLVVYCALFVTLFIPWGAGLAFPWGWLVFWLKLFGLVVLVTLVAATHARYRIDQAVRWFAALLVVAFGALALASLGY